MKTYHFCFNFINLIVWCIVVLSPQRIVAKKSSHERVSTTYHVNGKENDYISRAFAELQYTLKDFKRSVEIETRETNLLRETLEKCELCRKSEEIKTSGCEANPCFAGVVCTDLPNGGYRCGACPKGYTGDGADCHKLTTCRNRPCFQSVICNEDEAQGYRCGACPTGYTGNGISCASDLTSCSNNPCYYGVACIDYTEPPGYRCGACPSGTTGDGITCAASEEYESATPCTSPGFICAPCPYGYTGSKVQRFGLVRSNRRSQPVFGLLTIQKCAQNQTKIVENL